jgi:hypothetical protein
MHFGKLAPLHIFSLFLPCLSFVAFYLCVLSTKIRFGGPPPGFLPSFRKIVEIELAETLFVVA